MTQIIPRTMPVTLARLERRVISRLLNEFKKSDDAFDREEIREWLAEAYIELNRDFQLYCDSMRFDIGLGRYAFNLPNNILDQQILPKGVRVYPEGRSKAPVFPDQREWDYMITHYGDFSNPEGLYGSEDWAISPVNIDVTDADAGQFVILWPVEDEVTEGGEIHYVIHPGEFVPVRESEDLSITASVENGSQTVLLSDWPDDGVVRDLAFGVRATDADMPTHWYRTYTSDEDSLTFELDHAYEGATNATVNFTLSPVSPLEWRRPGLIMTSPIEYALYQHALREKGEDAALPYLNRWEMAKAKIAKNMRRGSYIEYAGAPDYDRHPGLRGVRR